MSYLARLKRLDSGNNFTHTPKTVLTKPTQPGSVSYGSSVLAHIEKINVANDGERIGTESVSPSIEAITDMPGKSPSVFDADSNVDRSSYSLQIAPDNDDRRTCMQCLNLRQRACGIAKPERGALVVANHGYRPAPETLHRCAGYQPNKNDPDQRSGLERWPGLP